MPGVFDVDGISLEERRNAWIVGFVQMVQMETGHAVRFRDVLSAAQERPKARGLFFFTSVDHVTDFAERIRTLIKRGSLKSRREGPDEILQLNTE